MSLLTPDVVVSIFIGFNNFTFGDVIMFSCLSEYELIGSEELKCGEHGNWSDKTPHCKLKHCAEDTSHISNGYVMWFE